MATFKKGQSMKDRRLVVVGAFDQKGEGMTGKNVAFAIAADQETEASNVITDPMLHYGTYKDDAGKEQSTYTVPYSKQEFERIEQAANKDGDKWVVQGNVFPSEHRKGLHVNTKSLTTPDVPFSNDKHKAMIDAGRAFKAEQREAKGAETEASPDIESQDLEM